MPPEPRIAPGNRSIDHSGSQARKLDDRNIRQPVALIASAMKPNPLTAS
jgi:hypothetical protein